MLHALTTKKDIRTFSVSPENPTGESGKGGMCPVEKGSQALAARDLGLGWKVNPYSIIEGGESLVMADIKGQGAIKHIWITDAAQYGRQLILRIWFDDRPHPAVEVPLSDFFVSAKYTEFRQVNSLPICVNPSRGLNCYFEMPYFTGFRMELENIGQRSCMVFYQIDCEEKTIPQDSLYFHAQFRRMNPVPFKAPYVILDNIRGRGHYVGTYLYWGSKTSGWWGEGEVKFYIDGDDEFPTVCGTGTEDYVCGAYCFEVNGKYQEYSTPYAGMSKVDYTDDTYVSQRYFNMYRWHITDPIYFTEKLSVTVQALGWTQDRRLRPLRDDVSSVAYWYSDNLDDSYPSLPDKDALELD